MENTDIVVADTQLLDNSQKTPAEIVIEIKRYLQKTSDNIIQIGNLLLEAKKQVPHGDWRDWLIHNIDFSQNTANRFMRCALVFSNYAPAHNLNQTQMFELLALPSKKIKDFIETQSDNKTPVDSMSKNDLREAIKSWKLEHQKTSSHASPSSAHSLKKLKSFFDLSSALVSAENFDITPTFKIPINFEMFQAYTKFLKNIFGFIVDGVILSSPNILRITLIRLNLTLKIWRKLSKLCCLSILNHFL